MLCHRLVIACGGKSTSHKHRSFNLLLISPQHGHTLSSTFHLVVVQVPCEDGFSVKQWALLFSSSSLISISDRMQTQKQLRLTKLWHIPHPHRCNKPTSSVTSRVTSSNSLSLRLCYIYIHIYFSVHFRYIFSRHHVSSFLRRLSAKAKNSVVLRIRGSVVVQKNICSHQIVYVVVCVNFRKLRNWPPGAGIVLQRRILLSRLVCSKNPNFCFSFSLRASEQCCFNDQEHTFANHLLLCTHSSYKICHFHFVFDGCYSGKGTCEPLFFFHCGNLPYPARKLVCVACYLIQTD